MAGERAGLRSSQVPVFVGRFSRTRQLSRALTRPSSRDCVLGHKVLSRGWEWGLESLPLALPRKRHHLGVHRAGARGVKSARNLQRLEPGRGRRGEEGERTRVSRLQGDSARNPLPRDLAPGPPAPKEALPSPGSCSRPAALPPPSSFVSPGGWAAEFPAKPWLPAQFFQTLQSGKAGALSG